RRAAQAHLPADRGSAALRRGRARDSRDPAERTLRRADALPGRARERELRARDRAARARRAPRATSRAGDGGDLFHAARRDRARRLSRAHAPHVADAVAQDVDRMADVDLRDAPIRDAALSAPDLVVVGAGWAGLSAAVHATLAGLRVHVLESAPTGGGRAREARLDFGAGAV